MQLLYMKVHYSSSSAPKFLTTFTRIREFIIRVIAWRLVTWVVQILYNCSQDHEKGVPVDLIYIISINNQLTCMLILSW
jgi:hypothetical protein